MKFHIKTYGCQMNERDSESVKALLQRHGLEHSASEDGADVIIVNTCSVRGKAEDKAIGKLGLMVSEKRKRPGLLVGAVGCMVQRLNDLIMKKVPGLDFAVGTHRLGFIPAIIERVKAGGGPVIETSGQSGDFEELTGHVDGGVSAFVNILLGCDRRCAYCVVPEVRGREWSRPAAGVIEEIRALAGSGVKEVILLGQSVMSYGLKNDVWSGGGRSLSGFIEPFPRLLEAAGAVSGIERIRFTSGHPSGCTDELARAMKEIPAVCGHMHLPMQSGSDRILRLMGRGYNADGYRDAVRRLRDAVPDMAVTTDIIVGFPSETDAEFEETRKMMEEIRFDNSFIFKYSPRPGTPAEKMKDDVPADEKMRRNKELLVVQDRLGKEINTSLVGRKLEVLAEGESLRNQARWSGRTRTNKITVFEKKPGMKVGDVIEVQIEKSMAQTLYGKVI